MAYLAVDKDGDEYVFDNIPEKRDEEWMSDEYNFIEPKEVYLPKGSIEKLTGKVITWEDEPIELKDNE